MNFRQVLTILRDLFMPQPRNSCPHCGGIRCIGACQFNDKQPLAVNELEKPLADSELKSGAAPQSGCEPAGRDATAESGKDQK